MTPVAGPLGFLRGVPWYEGALRPWYEGWSLDMKQPLRSQASLKNLKMRSFLCKRALQKKTVSSESEQYPAGLSLFSSKINNEKSTHFLLKDNLTPWSRRWGPTKMSKETNIYKKRPTKETYNKHYLGWWFTHSGSSRAAASFAIYSSLLIYVGPFWYILVPFGIYWSLLTRLSDLSLYIHLIRTRFSGERVCVCMCTCVCV